MLSQASALPQMAMTGSGGTDKCLQNYSNLPRMGKYMYLMLWSRQLIVSDIC